MKVVSVFDMDTILYDFIPFHYHSSSKEPNCMTLFMTPMDLRKVQSGAKLFNFLF